MTSLPSSSLCPPLTAWRASGTTWCSLSTCTSDGESRQHHSCCPGGRTGLVAALLRSRGRRQAAEDVILGVQNGCASLCQPLSPQVVFAGHRAAARPSLCFAPPGPGLGAPGRSSLEVGGAAPPPPWCSCLHALMGRATNRRAEGNPTALSCRKRDGSILRCWGWRTNFVSLQALPRGQEQSERIRGVLRGAAPAETPRRLSPVLGCSGPHGAARWSADCMCGRDTSGDLPGRYFCDAKTSGPFCLLSPLWCLRSWQRSQCPHVQTSLWRRTAQCRRAKLSPQCPLPCRLGGREGLLRECQMPLIRATGSGINGFSPFCLKLDYFKA